VCTAVCICSVFATYLIYQVAVSARTKFEGTYHCSCSIDLMFLWYSSYGTTRAAALRRHRGAGIDIVHGLTCL
jgi:hypothetical protein